MGNLSMSCPCGNSGSYEECCGPYHRGEAVAPTPEALMRSRYSAFARGEIDYIVATHHPKGRDEIDIEGLETWSKESEWLGLEVLHAESEGDTGIVEFVARYRQSGQEQTHRERSRFARIDGQWFYEDGEIAKPQPVVNESPKVGRNEPCPCGSGKKFKKCCGK